MSSPATAPHPVERQDVHKSCRTIETLSGALNDYCKATSALAAIQKRLSKALRDAAGLKTNSQFAANAFGASSIVLEVLADVSGKFAKIAEKESHGVSSEIKKWFKKLAKEEKAHDERMNEANARIKQAGQSYEKKSKKGSKDAGDEHARYIHLLSVIGPEMSQEKYNHAVNVTRQHTLVTFHVAASLSRVADAEWSRTCECVRRVSPTIGPLAEWRSLCEGAWIGSLPDDLPEPSSETLPAQPPITPAVSEWGQNGLSTPVRRLLPVPPLTSHSPGSVSAPTATSLDPPRSPFSAPSQNQGSISSINTLSAFPFPPTHFPVPLAVNEAELQRQQIQLQTIQSARSRAGSPHSPQPQDALAPPAPIVADSPKEMVTARLPELDASESSQPLQMSQTWSAFHRPSPAAHAPQMTPRPDLFTSSPEDRDPTKPIASRGDPKKARRLSLIARTLPSSDEPVQRVLPSKQAEHPLTEREFGVHTDSTRNPIKSHSVDGANGAKKRLERTDSTHSAGSHVAALRNRYTRRAETPSQGPKDIPRLPMSVSEMASRYQPVDDPLSPRRAVSPNTDRFPPDISALTSRRDQVMDENEIRRRKQRIEGLAELELKEKEHELRQRERELTQRAPDFERNRLHFLHSRPPEPGNTTDGPKGPRNNNGPFQHKRGSQSVTHFDPPSTTTTMTSSLGISPPSLICPSTSHSPTRSPVLPSKDHAPFCGCDTCSVSKYRVMDVSPSPRDLRPPEPPIRLRSEKPKGWIRRLSMPSVNVTFSLDAKKNASTTSLKAGIPLPVENGRLRKRSLEQGIANTSRAVTGLRR